MTNRASLYVVVLYMGLIYVIGTRCLVEGLPTTGGIQERAESDIIESKIEIFKQDILNKLGYDRVPVLTNVTQNIEEKRRMIQQYRRYMEERESSFPRGRDEDEDEPSVQSRTFYSSQYEGDRPKRVPVRDWNVGNTFRLFFNTLLSHPGDPTYELHVDSAKLKVFVNEVKPENLQDKFSVEKHIRVNVYQLLLITSTSNYKRKLLDSKIVTLEQIGWQSFEISKAVQDWIDNPEANLGLEIATESQNIKDVLDISLENRVKAIESNNGSNNTIFVPNIDIYAQERSILKRVKRRGRRRGDCKKGDGESRCCRHPIQIHFKDIGWDDWIIAPTEYRGYYCAGTCPYRYRMANTFSAIKALLHLNTLNSKKEVPSPCCVATKLSPFTILHYDMEGRYTFSDYPELVVEQCKCG